MEYKKVIKIIALTAWLLISIQTAFAQGNLRPIATIELDSGNSRTNNLHYGETGKATIKWSFERGVYEDVFGFDEKDITITHYDENFQRIKWEDYPQWSPNNAIFLKRKDSKTSILSFTAPSYNWHGNWILHKGTISIKIRPNAVNSDAAGNSSREGWMRFEFGKKMEAKIRSAGNTIVPDKPMQMVLYWSPILRRNEFEGADLEDLSILGIEGATITDLRWDPVFRGSQLFTINIPETKESGILTVKLRHNAVSRGNNKTEWQIKFAGSDSDK